MALRGRWEEAKFSKVELNDCSPKTFELFLYYLVRKTLPRRGSALYGKRDFDRALSLCRLWEFASLRIAKTLQNDTMAEIVQHLSSLTGPAIAILLELAYDHDHSSLLSQALFDEELHIVVAQGLSEHGPTKARLVNLKIKEGSEEGLDVWSSMQVRATDIGSSGVEVIYPSALLRDGTSIAKYMV